MLGHNLHIIVLLVPVQLVLDAKVGEVDLVVEVRQVVLVRPALDLARVAIGPAIAVRAAAVGCLQPFLVLAFELLVEDDTVDIGALFAKALGFPQVRAIQLRIVGKFARPVHARVEGLLASATVVSSVALQEAVTAFSQRHGAVAATQPYRFH